MIYICMYINYKRMYYYQKLLYFKKKKKKKKKVLSWVILDV